MGLTKAQAENLVNNIQNLLDNPIQTIDWENISEQFKQLLENGVEYDDEEIQYLLRKLRFPKDIPITSIFVIADELIVNYKLEKMLPEQIINIEEDNKELITFLRTLRFPNVNNHVLSYETDHWRLIDEFEKLLKNGIEYNIDDIRKWLIFNKQNNLLEDNVIDDIVKIAEFTQLNFSRPKHNFM